jgi:hypothetical protein
MPGTVVDDVRTLDPVSYIRALGLQPEDSYGFLPMKLDEGSSLLYLYRERLEYEERRPKLAPPVEATQFGPVRIEPAQQVEMQVPNQPGGALGDIIAQAQQMQEAWGGAPTTPIGNPGDTVSSPDPERLARLAKLRESGAITVEEYQRMVQEEGTPTSTPAAEATGAPQGGAEIVAHRLYPGMRMRSSTRQLNRFLPIYCETVGLSPEDTYGVFPFQTRYSASGADNTDTLEWDDYWIVYRDRPEYRPGREAYAQEMDKKGRWPKPLTAPGVGESRAGGPRPGKVEVEKDRWPRKALVVKQSGPELADSLREKISKWGYEPEDSYGFCPNFAHGSIYFAWRKG